MLGHWPPSSRRIIRALRSKVRKSNVTSALTYYCYHLRYLLVGLVDGRADVAITLWLTPDRNLTVKKKPSVSDERSGAKRSEVRPRPFCKEGERTVSQGIVGIPGDAKRSWEIK